MQERLGRYRIESELGKGGMGVVYRAVDERLGKIVALKMLSEAQAQTPESHARLRREARAAAILSHPSIVGVYDYDEFEGRPFVIYEYVEGKTLDRVKGEGPIAEDKILDISRQIATALAYAHERGIIHRDIKPQNIIVTPEGTAKILDYGLAKNSRAEIASANGSTLDHLSAVTEAGTIVGTVQYMSPEQIGGESLDGRTDIFSLGVVIHELACGSNPFLGGSIASTIGKIMSPTPPAHPGLKQRVSDELWEIICHCLQKRREDRYPSAHALAEDLRRIQGPVSQSKRAIKRAAPAQALIPRSMARASLILLQFLYLSIYAAALVHFYDLFVIIFRHALHFWGTNHPSVFGYSIVLTTIYLTSGCVGIPVRLFLIASVSFDDPTTGTQFSRMFPLLFLLDELWALAPLFLIDKWPAGATLICVTFLAYLPITHRNLVRSSYSAGTTKKPVP